MYWSERTKTGILAADLFRVRSGFPILTPEIVLLVLLQKYERDIRRAHKFDMDRARAALVRHVLGKCEEPCEDGVYSDRLVVCIHRAMYVSRFSKRRTLVMEMLLCELMRECVGVHIKPSNLVDLT
jgi:hypothetical protein